MTGKLIAVIIRHGTTELNENGVIRGWVDVPLDDDGRKQAQNVAKFLEKYPIRQIWSSPLERAVHTADTYAKPHGIMVNQHRSLLPWQIGVFGGLMKEGNEQAVGLFVRNPEIPVPNGESLQDFEQRVFPFFDALTKSNRMAAIFTHTTVITVLENLVEGERKHAPYFHESVQPGGVLELHKTAGGYTVTPVFGKAKPARLDTGS